MKRSVFGAALGVIVFIGPAFAQGYSHGRVDSWGNVTVRDTESYISHGRVDSLGNVTTRSYRPEK